VELSLTDGLCTMLYPLSAAHLVFVPLVMYPTALTTAHCVDSPVTYDHSRSDRVLKGSMLVCAAFVAVGIFHWAQTLQYTIEIETNLGIQTCSFVEKSPLDLVGVIATSLWCTAVGSCLWRRCGYKTFFYLQLLGFFGQGVLLILVTPSNPNKVLFIQFSNKHSISLF
jgi:hypothetical protein